jgi:ribonuclease P protein subunit POP4
LEKAEMIKGKNYEITARNLLGHEMIGLEVKVVKSTDQKRIGVNGIIVEETQNTFEVKSGGKKIVLPKKECEFEFNLGEEKVIVNGAQIVKRPEDRAKEWNHAK